LARGQLMKGTPLKSKSCAYPSRSVMREEKKKQQGKEEIFSKGEKKGRFMGGKRGTRFGESASKKKARKEGAARMPLVMQGGS